MKKYICTLCSIIIVFMFLSCERKIKPIYDEDKYDHISLLKGNVKYIKYVSFVNNETYDVEEFFLNKNKQVEIWINAYGDTTEYLYKDDKLVAKIVRDENGKREYECDDRDVCYSYDVYDRNKNGDVVSGKYVNIYGEYDVVRYNYDGCGDLKLLWGKLVYYHEPDLKFKYRYDAHGNWVKRKCKLPLGIIIDTLFNDAYSDYIRNICIDVERTIEYY